MIVCASVLLCSDQLYIIIIGLQIYTELQLYTRHMNQYIIAQSRHLLFANSFLSMTLSVMAVKLSLNTGRRTGNVTRG